MKEYSTDVAIEINGIFSAYLSGLSDEKEMCNGTRELLNFSSFCNEQQERLDLGLPPKIHTINLIKTMIAFLKEDRMRFSGMDVDKGYFNGMDVLHLEAERWVEAFINYHRNQLIVNESQAEISITETNNKIGLPAGLQTDEAIKRFARAEQEGVIERTQTGYRKKGITKAQLAYFLRKTYQAEAKSGAQFPETELNRLFAESRLGKAVSQLADNNGGSKPRGYQIIDALFVD